MHEGWRLWHVFLILERVARRLRYLLCIPTQWRDVYDTTEFGLTWHDFWDTVFWNWMHVAWRIKLLGQTGGQAVALSHINSRKYGHASIQPCSWTPSLANISSPIFFKSLFFHILYSSGFGINFDRNMDLDTGTAAVLPTIALIVFCGGWTRAQYTFTDYTSRWTPPPPIYYHKCNNGGMCYCCITTSYPSSFSPMIHTTGLTFVEQW